MLADAVIQHLTTAADAVVWHLIRFVAVIIVIAMMLVVVTMLHPSLILAETVADVTETKENAGGHRYSMPSLL